MIKGDILHMGGEYYPTKLLYNYDYDSIALFVKSALNLIYYTDFFRE